MKLRNKKTGLVGDLIGSYNCCPYIAFSVDYHDGNPIKYEYSSLEAMFEEWEDYEQKEPLIKNEKVRKAVRAFSEAIQEKKHILVIKQCGLGIAEFSNGSRFWIRLPLSNETMDALEDRTYYTITELCGEEEEC